MAVALAQDFGIRNVIVVIIAFFFLSFIIYYIVDIFSYSITSISNMTSLALPNATNRVTITVGGYSAVIHEPEQDDIRSVSSPFTAVFIILASALEDYRGVVAFLIISLIAGILAARRIQMG